MDFHVSVMIFPLFPTPATNTIEARKQGELKAECIKLAKKFEAIIKAAAEGRCSKS